jgi:hypothetical protein
MNRRRFISVGDEFRRDKGTIAADHDINMSLRGAVADGEQRTSI